MGFHNKNKGAAMLEFAILLPLLLIVMIGVLEVSLFLIQDNTLNKSVRESSRYLARNLGLQGCHSGVAENVVDYNMDSLFPSGTYAEFTNANGSYAAQTICVNNSTGAVSDPSDIGASCATNTATCAAGNHLHVRVTATYNAVMVTQGLIIPTWGNINFSPVLQATSIMRVQ
ncbi:MAG: TadE/TadG family type IV pilus assembly protein [Gammaproteobacteria bacterium]